MQIKTLAVIYIKDSSCLLLALDPAILPEEVFLRILHENLIPSPDLCGVLARGQTFSAPKLKILFDGKLEPKTRQKYGETDLSSASTAKLRVCDWSGKDEVPTPTRHVEIICYGGKRLTEKFKFTTSL